MDIILRDSIGSRDALIDTAGVTFRAASAFTDGSRGIGSDGVKITPAAITAITPAAAAAFTWEFFIRPLAPPSTYGLVVGAVDGASGIYITNQGGTPRLSAIDTAGGNSDSGALVYGTLYHVAIVSDGADVKVYVNAVNVTAVGADFDGDVPGTFNSIFSDDAGDPLACTMLDELAYYPLALTAPKVTAHYAARLIDAAAYRALVVADGATHLWSLEEGVDVLNGTFTGAANGGYLSALPGYGLRFTLEVGSGDSFSGKVELQRSRNGGVSWEAVDGQSFDGTTAAIDDSAPIDRTVVNETPAREWYRLANVTASGDDGIDWVLERAEPDVARPSTLATGAEMVAWLATLPTSDPNVAGEPYLDSGVLTVSAG